MAQLLDVWIESFPAPIGKLASTEDGTLGFSYRGEYLSAPSAIAISLSLPLRDEPFGDVLTRPFFLNLLPENNQLNQFLETEGVEPNDIAGILALLGADLTGALSCLPEGHDPVKFPGDLETDYELIDEKLLEQIVSQLGFNAPLPGAVKDPSPVAGIQRKIALTKIGDQFAVPKPNTGAPTTHILKVPDDALPREAYYEAQCAKLAHALGLDAADSQSRWIGQYEVVISTRYDRRILDGKVYRLHQEDFAQALGLPPRLKYERDGKEGRVFDVAAILKVLGATKVPAVAIDAFLKDSFFNLAIGNTDNHAKNHALLYDDGPIPRLAPLYDLVPVRLSTAHHHYFSFRIGHARELKELTAPDILAFLKSFSIEGARAKRFLRQEIAPLIRPLAELGPADGEYQKKLYAQISYDAASVLRIIGEAAA